MRALAAALAFLVSFHAHALNTWGTDMSDLWYNPSESGWGVNLSHQSDTIFATLFVYGSDGKTKWYVADGLKSLGNTFTFTGQLYETSGPYFGGGFNPASVNARAVGTMTFTGDVESGTLSYSVDGVSVTKSVQRQTFKGNNLTGSYVGGAIGTASGCGASSGGFSNTAAFSITHSGNSLSIVASISSGISCTYSGTYSQWGRMGDVSGTLSCSNGGHGAFRAFELEASYQGFFTRYTADYGNGCTETGRIGGLRL